MSVLRRPPRGLLSLIIAVLCLASTFTLCAQSEEVPVPTSESVVTNSESVVPTVVSTVENVYEGNDKPCGKCGTCIDRAAAFKANGISDPAL